MKTEIEVKFLDIDVEGLRARLRDLGGTCKVPMRLMRRVAIHNDFMKTGKDSFLRVRDEGDKVTMTYKQFDDLSLHGAKEIEVEVSHFEDTIELLAQAGLPAHTRQETRRETWTLDGAEIMLDEWPWLKPYAEIEAESESIVRAVAKKLSFDWDTAVFGDVMAAYRVQYPHLTETDTIGSIADVRFGLPLPELFGGKVGAI